MKKLFAQMAVLLIIAASLGGCTKNNTEDTSNRQRPAAPTAAAAGKAKGKEPVPAEKSAGKGAGKGAGKSAEKSVEKGAGKDAGKSTGTAAEAAFKFSTAVINHNTSIKGGTLKVALVSSSAFTGVLNPCFYEDNYDAQLLGWFSESLLSFDENFIADQDGAATYDYNIKSKTVTLHMRKGVKWQDGEPVTLDDLVFAYEVICDRDYEGFRFNETFTNIQGVEEYHGGRADTISGLKLSKDKMTLVIHFKEFYPSILAGGFWTNPIPRHYYGDIAVKDMAADAKTRSYPIGFGPFQVKNIVPGESVEFQRFNGYWRGRPKLDGVIITVVKPELVPAAMKEGKFDVAEFSTQQYQDYMEPTNYTYLGQIQTAFGYTGFKLGSWNAKENENVYNPEAKLAEVRLRQAIGYAVDNQAIAQYLYRGLRFLATTVITPRHRAYQNTRLEGYVYDPERARQLLDEAGYKDVDGDGYRETPEGEELTITWATMDGESADIIAQFKIQCWKEVGLRVKLYHGRLTEFNAFYEAVEGDDPAIDMYDAAWSTGYNPNPSVLWGRNSAANYTRYTSDRFDAILRDISSEKAWEDTFRAQKYKEWQEAFFQEAPAIPTLWRIELVAVNNRVKYYEDVSNDIKQTGHLIELTAKEPIK